MILDTNPTEMFDVLDETEDDRVAIRVGRRPDAVTPFQDRGSTV